MRRKRSNYGAFIPFIGIVRAENGIEALSFDIYEPLLLKWFKKWENIAKLEGAKVKMAHSIGDVPVHTSSFFIYLLYFLQKEDCS